MNKVILMGRLARDVDLRQTPSGISVARFTIAVNRRFAAKDAQQQADFISCVAWRQTGEFISRYFHKGSMIAVVGSIQTRSWDGQDGKRQYATDVVVDRHTSPVPRRKPEQAVTQTTAVTITAVITITTQAMAVVIRTIHIRHRYSSRLRRQMMLSAALMTVDSWISTVLRTIYRSDFK